MGRTGSRGPGAKRSRPFRNRGDRGPEDGLVTHARQRGLERLESRLKVLEAADAHVADAEDLALQMPLSPGDNGPVSLPKFLPECAVVDARLISDSAQHG